MDRCFGCGVCATGCPEEAIAIPIGRALDLQRHVIELRPQRYGLAHDARRFDMAAVRDQAHLAHRVEDAALHRFLAVAHFRQRAALDHRHGVFKIGALGVFGDLYFVGVGQRGEGGELGLAG